MPGSTQRDPWGRDPLAQFGHTGRGALWYRIRCDHGLDKLGESRSSPQGPTGSVWARRVRSPVAYLVTESVKCFKDRYHYFPPSECSCHLRDCVPLRQDHDFNDVFMSVTSPVFQTFSFVAV